MGDYEDVLASLETLNHSVLKAMGYTKKVMGCGWLLGLRVWDFLQSILSQGAWTWDAERWVGLALGWAFLGAPEGAGGGGWSAWCTAPCCGVWCGA